MSILKYIISALPALIVPAAAFAQETAPEVDYLYNNANAAYFYVAPDAGLEMLTLDLYTDVRSFQKIATIDLLSDDLAIHAVSGMDNVYCIPVNKENDSPVVYQIHYRYAGGQEVTGQLFDGNDAFVYMTDLPGGKNNSNVGAGWGNPFYDIAFNSTEPLRTMTSTYAKGYGIHGPGWVLTPAGVDLSQFSRFCVDLGGQIITNPTRGKLGYILYYDQNTKRMESGNLPWQTVVEWEYELEDAVPGNRLKLDLTNGGDGNTNDVVCVGAPRFYYRKAAGTGKQHQTVEFETPGGTIFDENPEVELSAFASAGTPVFYSIVQGAEIATLEGNVLRPKDGYTGEIVVEAMTLGDRNNSPASATQTFNFRFGPTVKYLYTHRNGDNTEKQTMYFYMDPRGKKLEKFIVDIYDNVRSFTKIKTVDLLSEGLDNFKVDALRNVYAIPLDVPGGEQPVQKLTYKFAGEDEVEGKLCEGNEPFVYMTDLPQGTVRPGWGSASYDKAYDNNGPLRTSRYTYAKGYGIHAAGWVETPSTLDLSQFTRFRVDVGGQVISNPTRGKLGFLLYNGISQAYLNTGNVPWSDVYEWDFPLQATGAGKTLKLEFTAGGDGNTNDIVCIGAPRFYYHYDKVLSQTLEWTDEELLNNYVAFSIPLTAKASSGLPVVYHLVSGAEYARLENGNTLRFHTIPSEGAVVVEAYQPGSKDYEPSETLFCRFRIRKSEIIKADERKELQGGNDIDELVIMANAHSAGQAVVKDGIVNVKKLVLKYTFVPGQWNYVSFPSDLDLEAISDLRAKGFTCATAEGTPGTYLLREYNSRMRSENPDESPWIDVPTGKVTGMKGYIMKLESDNDTPVEITFNIDNVALDFDNTMRTINLAIDMSQCEPETRHTVYIRPQNVKGNTLRVDMRYVPTSRNDLPLNHAKALEAMRITRSEDGGSIRLTLPEQTPARVAIFDRKGEKMLKAVSYVAPMKIDVSDLKRGKYRMVVLYGPASIEKELDL